MMVSNLSASDYSDPLADLDFHDFDHFVAWLPKRQKEVFIAELLRVYISPKTGLKRYIRNDRYPWAFVALSKHDYQRILKEAIANIKRRAGLI